MKRWTILFIILPLFFTQCKQDEGLEYLKNPPSIEELGEKTSVQNGRWERRPERKRNDVWNGLRRGGFWLFGYLLAGEVLSVELYPSLL